MATVNTTTKDNKKIAYQYFISKGYSPAAAAGIVGNLVAESGVNPTRKQDGGNAMGIAQWEPPRWNNFVRVAKGRGLDPMALDTQLWYIDHELKSMDSRGAIDLKAFKEIQDGVEAPRIFMDEYERPRVKRFNERVEGAKIVGLPNRVKFEGYRPEGLPLSNTGDTVSQNNDMTTRNPGLTPNQSKKFEKIQKKVTKGAGVTGLNENEQEILRRKYGFAWSIYANDDTGSLFKLLAKAVKQDYTRDMFMAELENSAWAKRRDANEREFYLYENRNKTNAGEYLPEFTNSLNRLKSRIRQEVLRVTGQTINPDDYEEEIINYWRSNYDRADNPTEINNFVKGMFVKTFEEVSELGGTTGADQDDIREYAFDMGLRLSDTQTANYARQIALGETTIDGVKDLIRQETIKLYPGLKSSLQAGVTLNELSSNYLEQMARYLEIDPNSVDISNLNGLGKYVNQALNYIGPEGSPTMMPLYEFNKLLRSSPEWQKTENARNTYMDFGVQLLGQMGF